MEAASTHESARRKELGAFYTPPAMAAKLVEWAVRERGDRVLDPSFGGLVFLRAARDRLLALGLEPGEVRDRLFGIEVDEDAHAAGELQEELGLRPGALLRQDFFAASPGIDVPLCEAVVGNPPYVRYQGFNGSSGQAHELAAAAGVRLTRLASSWAPFLIHATSFVAPGGRLAQVLPAELLHAQYAMGVLDLLRTRFRTLSIAVFEERVFPGALEEVVLLFAEDRGEHPPAEVGLVSAGNVAELDLERLSAGGGETGAGGSPSGRSKLMGQLLPAEARAAYERLADHGGVQRFGSPASVDIGVVTGANDFFTLTAEEAGELDPSLLKPAVSKAAQVAGARLAGAEHDEMLRRGRKGLLFVATRSTDKRALQTARAYLERGRRAGIDQRYKCRVRDPWWALPLPRSGIPDLLLTYCANQHPRLALNEARVLQTNTIHGVSLAERDLAPALAAGFYNSLTLLSAELVGRSYGGGVLKLEPTEAENLLLPPITPELADLLPRVDALVRGRDLDAALDLVDAVVLGANLGLGVEEVRALRAGGEQLRRRRLSRGAPPRRAHGGVEPA